MGHIDLIDSPLTFIVNNVHKLKLDKYFRLYACLWLVLLVGVGLYTYTAILKSLESYDHPNLHVTVKQLDYIPFPPLIFCASNTDSSQFTPEFCHFSPRGPAREPTFDCDYVSVPLSLQAFDVESDYHCVVLRGIKASNVSFDVQSLLQTSIAVSSDKTGSAEAHQQPPLVQVPKHLIQTPQQQTPATQKRTQQLIETSPFEKQHQDESSHSQLSLQPPKQAFVQHQDQQPQTQAESATQQQIPQEQPQQQQKQQQQHDESPQQKLLAGRIVANATYPSSQFQILFDSHFNTSGGASYKSVLFHAVIHKKVTEKESSEHRYVPDHTNNNPIYVPRNVDAWTRLFQDRTEDIEMKLSTTTYLDETVVFKYGLSLRPIPCVLSQDSGCQGKISALIHFHSLEIEDAAEEVDFDWLYVLGATGGALTVAELVFLVVHPALQYLLFGKRDDSDNDNDNVHAPLISSQHK
eukprot:c2518_g1_i1.p1 GENE.c2518_g1_i1~~c2518_g1_i1.p1  ORF type:complete len:465 (-),score=122.37 c2518_g1_i1:227-1621(-)